MWVKMHLCSNGITHPSTNQTQRCLTSLIGREAVCSTWYGRWREERGTPRNYAFSTPVTHTRPRPHISPRPCPRPHPHPCTRPGPRLAPSHPHISAYKSTFKQIPRWLLCKVQPNLLQFLFPYVNNK